MHYCTSPLPCTCTKPPIAPPVCPARQHLVGRLRGARDLSFVRISTCPCCTYKQATSRSKQTNRRRRHRYIDAANQMSPWERGRQRSTGTHRNSTSRTTGQAKLNWLFVAHHAHVRLAAKFFQASTTRRRTIRRDDLAYGSFAWLGRLTRSRPLAFRYV